MPTDRGSPFGSSGSGGPPKGSSSDSPYAQQIPFDRLADQVQKQLGGDIRVPSDDPAFQPPTGQGLVQNARMRLVYRELPLVNIQSTWQPRQIQGALQSHISGIFEESGQLVDSIFGDPRVQATISSRTSGLFGREVRFRPANDSAAAKECMIAWADHWPQFASTSAMTEMHAYAILMGFMLGQLAWDTTQRLWLPYVMPWHPRFSYYHWPLRRYVALSQDGQLAIQPGDGKWFCHFPYGQYRGWMRGCVRQLAQPWLLRVWAQTYMARFAEVHAMPIRKAIVPAASDEAARDAYAQKLAGVGAETTIMVQTGVDGAGQDYDLELVEAKDTAWEVFPGLIDRCDMDIVLAVMMQNLTTEVTGGSFAATKSHMDIRQGGIEFDNGAWCTTIRQQAAKPFAWVNFGDADLAPYTDWDVSPREDLSHNADQWGKFMAGLQAGALAGVHFEDPAELQRFAADRFGLRGLPRLSFIAPATSGGAPGGGFSK